MGFRFYRRKSLGRGVWAGFSKSGVSVGRRGRFGSASLKPARARQVDPPWQGTVLRL